MSELIPVDGSVRIISSMGDEALMLVRNLEEAAFGKPQAPVRIEHDFHAGIYARTMYVEQPPEGMVHLITGVLIKIPTLLVSHGDALVYIGEDKPLRIAGHNVIQAAAGRKQAFCILSKFCLTMSFATDAKTVEEAEAAFTDEVHLLTTRRLPCPA